jgi:predicted nucleic acid-binding protein
MVFLLTGAGPGAEAARLLARDPEWAAPPILLSELRNVMVGLLRRGEIQAWDAVGICQDAEAVLGDRIASVPVAPVLEAALEGRLSAYDAELVVLARRLGVPLVTADQAILEGARDVAVPL